MPSALRVRLAGVVPVLDTMSSSATSSRVYLVGSDRFYLLGTSIVVASYVLEAPLRYVLSTVSLELLIYARDAAMVMYAATAALSWVGGQREAFLVVFVAGLLIVHTLIGCMTFENVRQPLFGLKVFLPLLLGLVLAPLLPVHKRALRILAWSCFTVTAIGVVLNYAMEFPWIGMDYNTPLGAREVSRRWWSRSEARLPGFTRASYLAAQLMLTSLVPILATRPKWSLRIALYGTATTIIVLTTSKAPLVGLVTLAICDLLTSFVGLNSLLMLMLIGLFLACTMLPLLSIEAVGGSQPAPGWFESFMERVTDMWPRAFALFDGPTSIVFGRGLGGIGSPQRLGEEQLLNSGDNLMLFLFVTFGLASLAYMAFVVVKIAVLVPSVPHNETLCCAFGWMIVLFAVGLTSQLIEDSVTCTTLGMSIGLAFSYPPGRPMTRQVFET